MEANAKGRQRAGLRGSPGRSVQGSPAPQLPPRPRSPGGRLACSVWMSKQDRVRPQGIAEGAL